jgi:cytochrome c-type biogenesis protein CcmH
MTFWIAGGAMTALATIAVLAPVFGSGRRTIFAGRAQAVYADQLAEVSRDEASGVISGAEAESARVEIKRRLLKAAREGKAETTTQAPRGRWMLFVGALLIPALGLGVYGKLGNWQLPSVPFSERADERAQAQKFQIIVEKLRNRLLEDGEVKVDGWMMLAQTYLRMGAPNEAVWAMETLIDRGGAAGRPEILSLYAEALIQSDNGIVSPKAEATLNEVLATRPDDVAAIYYKAIALEQSGDIKQAFVMLRDRIQKEKIFQPWMQTVAARANALAARTGENPVKVPAVTPPLAIKPKKEEKSTQ